MTPQRPLFSRLFGMIACFLMFLGSCLSHEQIVLAQTYPAKNPIPQNVMKAMVSSTYSSHANTRMLDGNLGTHWHSAEGDPQSVTLDLGMDYQIYQFRFWPRQDKLGQPGYEGIYLYSLYISEDGVNFKRLQSGELDGSAMVSGAADDIGIRFEPVETRFIKVVTEKTKRGFTVLAEVNVDQVPGTTPVLKPLPNDIFLKYYSEALIEKLKDSVVLYENSPVAYVRNHYAIIDEQNTYVMPFTHNNDAKMVPARFVTNALGGLVTDPDERLKHEYVEKFQYLSNLTPASFSGYGPYGKTGPKKDVSHKNLPITLNGTVYPKGLGHHAAAEVTYAIPDPTYNRFHCVIGIDDGAGSNGSVIFSIYADNVLAYTSSTLTGADGGVAVDLDITGAAAIRLVAGDAGNGNANDHAVWADAQFQTVIFPEPLPADFKNRLDLQVDGKTVRITQDSAAITVDGAAAELNAPVISRYGVLMLPLAVFTAHFDRHLTLDARGIWIVGKTGDVLSGGDTALWNELYQARYGVVKPDVEIHKQADPPADAALRQQRFDARFQADTVAALGQEFCALLDLTKPSLAAVKETCDQAQYAEALRRYQLIFAQKLLQSNWLENAAFDKSQGAKIKGISADELMFDILGHDGQRLLMGDNPATVNWAYEVDYYTTDMHPVDYLPQVANFYPLLQNFAKNKNPLYLQKWADFIDSLCINGEGIDIRDAVDSGYNSREYGAYEVYNLAKHLRQVYKSLPSGERGVHEATFARLMRKLIVDYIPPTLEAVRSQPQNHNMYMSGDIIPTGILLDDFLCGDFLIQEGMKAAIAYSQHVTYPDGSEIQSDVHYAPLQIESLGTDDLLLRQARPDMRTREWINHVRNTVYARSEYLLRMAVTSNTNNYGAPIGMRHNSPGMKTNQESQYYNTKLVNRLLPDYFPDVLTMPFIRQQVNALSPSPNPAIPMPGYLSDALPYQGVSILRAGFTPQSQYGILYSRGNDQQDGFRIHANNAFGLYAFGRDLLTFGETGPYTMVPSPLTVDGLESDAEIGVYDLGHRRLYDAIDPDHLNPFRHSTSAYFDLAEGAYSGLFTTPYRGDPYRVNDALAQGISDVRHHRQVHFVRQAGLWIVTDRVKSPASHRYDFRWILAGGPTYLVREHDLGFAPEHVQVDSAAHTIKTMRNGTPNVSLYQFSSAALQHARNGIKLDSSVGYTTNDFIENGVVANTLLEGSGARQLVTVIYPRETSNHDLTAIAAIQTPQDGVSGFEAAAGNGDVVKYLAAPETTAWLELEEIAAQAESLLLTTDSAGHRRVLALGARVFKIAGIAQELAYPDFEGKLDGATLTEVQPIYTPIQTVRIEPEISQFVNDVAVSLSCATAEVEIHYTLDGSVPTLASPVYAAPMTITEDTTVKARAYRKGVTQEVHTQAGTWASVTAVADFYKTSAYHEPVDLGEAVLLLPGLNYEYYEGSWQELFMKFAQMDRMEPVKTGVVKALFDIQPRLREEPFGFKYSGYIVIPADGAYTFYAPDSYFDLSVVKGHEINLYLDGVKWNLANQRFGRGAWTTPLKAGLHAIEVRYADYRGPDARIKFRDGVVRTVNFDRTGAVTGRARMNFPDLPYMKKDLVWSGVTPTILMSGPNLPQQAIPPQMLYRLCDDHGTSEPTVPPAAVPEPATVLLVGIGAGLIGLLKRIRR